MKASWREIATTHATPTALGIVQFNLQELLSDALLPASISADVPKHHGINRSCKPRGPEVLVPARCCTYTRRIGLFLGGQVDGFWFPFSSIFKLPFNRKVLNDPLFVIANWSAALFMMRSCIYSSIVSPHRWCVVSSIQTINEYCRLSFPYRLICYRSS